MLDWIAQDVHYSFRSLRSNFGFAITALLSMTIGIGGATAVFALINAIMLKSLPVSHPEELLQVTSGTQQYFSNPVWEEFRDRQDLFSNALAYGEVGFDAGSAGERRERKAQYVSGSYFRALGITPSLGRLLVQSDDMHGCPGVVVLSHGFWEGEYGSRADVISNSLSVEGHPFPIIGVSRAGFAGLEVGASPDAFLPICAEALVDQEGSLIDANYGGNWGWLQIMGRPKLGLSAGKVKARLQALAPQIFAATASPRWLEEDRQTYLRRTLNAHEAWNGPSYARRRYRESLLVLMGLVAITLAIVCSNLSSLLVARNDARQREITIRLALGCGRRRLCSQMFVENLLLSGIGAMLGTASALAVTRFLAQFLNVSLNLTFDLHNFLFTVSITILCTLVFGVVPAMRSIYVPLSSPTKGLASTPAPLSRLSVQLVVVAQFGLSVVSAVTAGLLILTFWKLMKVEAGARPERIAVASVDLNRGSYSPERHRLIFQDILDRLRAMPGVYSATTSNIEPLCDCKATVDISIDGFQFGSRDDRRVLFSMVGDHYFQTLSIPLMAGRDFDQHDFPTSRKVAVVNQSMARKYFSDSNVLGRRIHIYEKGTITNSYQIIGIVADARYGSPKDEIAPTLYFTRNQEAESIRGIYYEVRTVGALRRPMIDNIKRVIAGSDRNASFEVSTLATRIDELVKREKLLATLSGSFGLLAMVLCAIGLYGLISSGVTRRRREIGIRLAIGAQRTHIHRMIMGEVSILITAGLTLGLGTCVWASRLIGHLLYSIAPHDPLVVCIAIVTLSAVGFLAAYLPASRVSRLDPITTLREE